MARRSLRPHLNQIRTWVRQGRTDAWIAHQLEVTVQQIEAFKREQGLAPDEDALIAAELEAAEAEATAAGEGEDEEEEEAEEEEGDGEARRRRSRRGGR